MPGILGDVALGFHRGRAPSVDEGAMIAGGALMAGGALTTVAGILWLKERRDERAALAEEVERRHAAEGASQPGPVQVAVLPLPGGWGAGLRGSF
jgi:hypothetical protein